MRFAIVGFGFLLLNTAAAQQYGISTFAGGAAPQAPILGPDLSIGSPQGVAADTAGNVYFAASDCVFKQDPNGIVARIAGTTRPGYSGDGGPAISAQLNLHGIGFAVAAGLAVDRAGNVFIADAGNHRVRRISGVGIMTTVAGNGTPGFSGDGGPAANAQLRYPSSVAVDGAGNLFIAADNRVRRVSPDEIITTVVGNGNFHPFCSTCGDGGPAVNAEVSPAAVAVDEHDNLYIADAASFRIREVSQSGIISTIAGRGRPSFNCYPSGDGGRAVDAQVCDPAGLAVDSAGNVFFADSAADFDDDFRQIVRRVSIDGSITTVAGVNCAQFCPPSEGEGGLATRAFLTGPLGLTIDGAGGLLISDPQTFRVKKVAPDGIIRTLAGGGSPPFAGEGGPATSAHLLYPTGVAADTSGNAFIADVLSNRIYKVSPDGIITTAAGGGTYDFSDGPTAKAELSGPYALAADGSGDVFFTDGSGRVRKISPNGMITTVAGYGGYGDSGDGGPAIFAAFRNPSGLAVDRAGNLFIADAGNRRIRKVSPDSIIDTVNMASDAGPIAVDEAGNLFIAAQFRISKLSPDAHDGCGYWRAGLFRRWRPRFRCAAFVRFGAGRGRRRVDLHRGLRRRARGLPHPQNFIVWNHHDGCRGWDMGFRRRRGLGVEGIDLTGDWPGGRQARPGLSDRRVLQSTCTAADQALMRYSGAAVFRPVTVPGIRNGRGGTRGAFYQAEGAKGSVCAWVRMLSSPVRGNGGHCGIIESLKNGAFVRAVPGSSNRAPSESSGTWPARLLLQRTVYGSRSGSCLRFS
jgi:sugar lactone lactonase YvrE